MSTTGVSNAIFLFDTFEQKNDIPTLNQYDAAYHCGIGKILPAAYQREFTLLEKGKCKTKFTIFYEWYATLNADQRQRVDEMLTAEYGVCEGSECYF